MRLSEFSPIGALTAPGRHASGDPDRPFHLRRMIRSDCLDRLETVPRLLAERNRRGRPWTVPPMDAQALAEAIDGPARLAGLDVGEVRDAIIAEAEENRARCRSCGTRSHGCTTVARGGG